MSVIELLQIDLVIMSLSRSRTLPILSLSYSIVNIL